MLVYVTWKSLIVSSVVISDASQGDFELKVPRELADGRHEVIVYTLDKRNSVMSSIYKGIINKAIQ